MTDYNNRLLYVPRSEYDTAMRKLARLEAQAAADRKADAARKIDDIVAQAVELGKARPEDAAFLRSMGHKIGADALREHVEKLPRATVIRK